MANKAVTERIRDFLTEHFPTARARGVSDDEPLLANGLVDSLGILEVITFLEEEWQVTVTDDELLPDNFQSITSLAAYVQRKLVQSPASLAKE